MNTDLAPSSNSCVFTNALPDDPASVEHYDSIRSLAARRGSPFLAVQLDCDIDAQVSRIDNPDRIALRKGADPAGYRWHRGNVTRFEPPQEDRFDIDTTNTSPEENAELIRVELVRRGFAAPGSWTSGIPMRRSDVPNDAGPGEVTPQATRRTLRGDVGREGLLTMEVDPG